VLEAAGVHVVVPDDLGDTGRPAFSKGFLEKAEDAARENVNALARGSRTAGTWSSSSPPTRSCSRETTSICSPPRPPRRSRTPPTASASTSIRSGWTKIPFDERAATDELVYHGHCHQKSVAKDHHAVGVLRRAGYAVDPLDSGCCGMAGSFGYESEHASMSERHRLDPLRAGRRERRRPHRRSRCFLPDTTRERARRDRGAADADRSRGRSARVRRPYMLHSHESHPYGYESSYAGGSR